jgi:hypothetical protein
MAVLSSYKFINNKNIFTISSSQNTLKKFIYSNIRNYVYCFLEIVGFCQYKVINSINLMK